MGMKLFGFVLWTKLAHVLSARCGVLGFSVVLLMLVGALPGVAQDAREKSIF